jgi:hypothetical protein
MVEPGSFFLAAKQQGAVVHWRTKHLHAKFATSDEIRFLL